MSTQIQLRRGTTAQHSTFTGAIAEITVDTDKDTVVVHDGSTAGGHPLSKEGHTHSGVYEPANPNLLETSDIGVSVQGYDADTAKTDATQTWTATQRTQETTDNDGSFDLNANIDFKCTPTGAITLTFTNIPATPNVQKGTIILDNSGAYAVSAHANTKVGSTLLSTISAAGIYWLAYRSSNGVVYVSATGALA